jgi:hypothetical protein
VLLGYVPDRHDTAIAVGDRHAEYTLAFIDTERVMAESTMPKVAVLLFTRVEPLMYRKVVLVLPAKAADGGFSMK